jgi:L-asparaginase
LRRQTIPIKQGAPLPRVDIVVNYAGANGDVVRYFVESAKVQGLVIAGFGGGTVTASIFESIKEARAKHIPVIISSRVPTGRMFPSSVLPGSVLSLQKIVCVLADNLSPQKARILLMLALQSTRDPASLQKYFDR